MQIMMKYRTYEILISLFVAAVLSMQCFMVIRALTGHIGGARYWPILNYAMYDDVHHEGDTVNAYYLLEGTLKDGSVVEISKEDLGVGFWNYLHLSNDLAKNEPDAVALLLKLHKKADQITEVRVKTLPVMLTRTGQAYKESDVVRSITLPAGREG